MKTITIILPDNFDEAVIITAMGSAPNGINVTTKSFKVENGLIVDFEKAKIDRNGIDNPGLPVIPVATAVFVNGNGDFNLNIKPCSVKLGEYAEMDGKFYDDKDLFREDYYELKGKFLKGKYSDTKSLYILLDQIAKKFFKKAIFLYVNIFM